MLLLALDTATSAVTVAVHDGSAVLAQVSTVQTRRHAEILTPSIAAAMRDAGAVPADLTEIAVGVGPGPFTGLRVGVATAVTLGLALDIPVHGVCSLDAIAAAVARSDGPEHFLVATDARRKEVYWATYRRAGDTVTREQELPQVTRPADLPAEVRALPTAGQGPALYPGDLGPALAQTQVSAADLAHVAVQALQTGQALLPVQPLYLRQPDAVPAAVQKSVLPR